MEKIIYNFIEQKKVEVFLNSEFKNKKIVRVSYSGLPSEYSNYKSKIIFGNYYIYKWVNYVSRSIYTRI